MIYIYVFIEGHTVHVVIYIDVFIEGHTDSVTCASFSFDSMYVATGDMSGLIKAWKVSTGEEVWSFQIADLEVDCKFVSNLLERYVNFYFIKFVHYMFCITWVHLNTLHVQSCNMWVKLQCVDILLRLLSKITVDGVAPLLARVDGWR